jgi:SAM-dependent methyltransferase
MGRPSSKIRQKPPSTRPAEPIRQGYDQLGPESYYVTHQADYRNPHEPIIRRLLETWSLKESPPLTSNLLDLACGSGEITVFFQTLGFTRIDSIDPFTGEAYTRRTGLVAKAHNFADIADGVLTNKSYDYVFCSFALHLAERSRLPLICMNLAEIANHLVILTPHKRPEIRPEWGWKMKHEQLLDRVRLRHYESMPLN